jgi:hypothetical protein
MRGVKFLVDKSGRKTAVTSICARMRRFGRMSMTLRSPDLELVSRAKHWLVFGGGYSETES